MRFLSCCPSGFDVAGHMSVDTPGVICLEQEPSGRSWVGLSRGADGLPCWDRIDPEECCPDSFAAVGFVDSYTVLCLEE